MVDEADFIGRLTSVFREQLDDEKLKIRMDTVRADLESWDSLAHVRIVMGVEAAYGIQLDVAEIESIKSVRDFYDSVNAHLSTKQR